MPLPYAIQGGRRPGALITWYQLGTETPEDLTGATLTGEITPVRPSGAVRAITGVLAVEDGPAGQFSWNYSAEDVADIGHFRVQFTATFPTGQTPGKSFPESWTVTG